MTVDELKAKLEQAPIGAELIAVDIDGEEYTVSHLRVEDDFIYLSLEDHVSEEQPAEIGGES